MLEHNVRLQVEVEELRRQLSDKQELLAAAAEAIDVLEQQVGYELLFKDFGTRKSENQHRNQAIKTDAPNIDRLVR